MSINRFDAGDIGKVSSSIYSIRFHKVINVWGSRYWNGQNFYLLGYLPLWSSLPEPPVHHICNLLIGNARESPGHVNPNSFVRWKGWALAQADRIDPVKSGLFLQGLEPGLPQSATSPEDQSDDAETES